MPAKVKEYMPECAPPPEPCPCPPPEDECRCEGDKGRVPIVKVITPQVPGHGTIDYNELENKPSITEPDFHTVIIEGDKTFDELGMRPLDALDIISLLG